MENYLLSSRPLTFFRGHNLYDLSLPQLPTSIVHNLTPILRLPPLLQPQFFHARLYASHNILNELLLPKRRSSSRLVRTQPRHRLTPFLSLATTFSHHLLHLRIVEIMPHDNRNGELVGFVIAKVNFLASDLGSGLALQDCW